MSVAPGIEAENLLFQLAEADPTLYSSNAWLNAAVARGTESAGRRLIDLIAAGDFDKANPGPWDLPRELAESMSLTPELRAHVYRLAAEAPSASGRNLLALLIGHAPDVEGLLLLMKLGHPVVGYPIERAVTRQIPSEDWIGSYEIVPVSAEDLRRRLLALTTDGGKSDLAARCLEETDEIRDRYGSVEGEPRHPDLASGKPWPIIRAPVA